jgi:hypothetical protein
MPKQPTRKQQGPPRGKVAKKADWEDEELYDEVDRHAGLHRRGAAAAAAAAEEEEEEEEEGLQPVLGLDMGDDGEDSDDDDDEDEEDDEEAVAEVSARAAEVRARADASLSGWGKKKSAYYEEDAEGEVDEEAAAEEEREARRLQSARAAALDEEDVTFGTAAAATAAGPAGSKRKRGSGGGGAALSSSVERVTRDVSALSRSARLDIVMADAPELVALLGEAQAALAAVRGTVAPILEAARAGRVPKGSKGLSYLQVKLQLWLAYITDIVFFLLLKAEGASVKEHPVVAQLLHIRTLLERMRPLDERLQFQVARLLKAARAGAAREDASEGAGEGEGGDEGEGEGEGEAAVDYSDLPDHPEARRRRRDARKAAAAGASDHLSARPNLGALLRHGDGGLARGAAAGVAGKPQKGKAGKKGATKAAAEEEEEKEEEGEEEEEGRGGGGEEGAEEGGGAYRPLHRSAVSYDGDGPRGKAARAAAQAAARLSKSALLSEIRASYSARPQEEDVDGVGGVRGRRLSAAAAAAAAEEAERTAHEEDTFTRLTLSRAQKARQKARAAEENQWDAFAELEDFGDLAAATGDGEEGGAGGGGSARAEAAAGALRARLARSVGAASASGMEAGFGKKRASAPAAAKLALEAAEGGGGEVEEEEEEGGGGGGGGRRRRRGGGHDDDEAEDPFFAAVAAAAALKRAKKAAAAAAAEEERAALIRATAGREDAPLDEGAGGHRKASQQILKNRGLVKYRKKEASNPRVAYRLKAEKQLKRRQGQAVTMRNKNVEGDNYGGEATGIRTNISKSRIFK